MSNLVPLSRNTMQQLKSQKDDIDRLDRIKSIVKNLYERAVNHASTTSETSFHSEIPRAPIQHPVGRPIKSPGYQTSGPSDPFYLNNMEHILSDLKKLFPDCDVTHALMAKGRNGKLYDLSKLDDKVLPFVDHTLEQSFILIDWS